MHGSEPTLQGRVLNERGDPFPGLRVAAVETGAAFGTRELGAAAVEADGTYAIPLKRRPRRRLRISVWDPWDIREVARSPPLDSDGHFPDVKVASSHVRGWRVPVDASPVTRGNRVEALVDGAAMFPAMVEAVDRARHHVHLLQLFLEPWFVAAYRDGGKPRRFVDALVDAARRGVEVRVLLNQNALLPDDVDAIREILEAEGQGRARVRGFLMAPDVMHSKLLLVDDEEAFVIGPPFQQRFWDTRAHPPLLDRRGTERPTHDLAVRLRGPAVRDATEDFARYWNHSNGDDPLTPGAPPPPAGDIAAQLVRTYPQDLFDDAPRGSRGILESYGRMFVEAQRFVYCENQYYTSVSFNRMLDRALAAKPQLDAILVLNHAVDVPGYIRWQKRRLRDLGYPHRDRLGVFTLWRPRRRSDGGVTLHRVYSHSKAAIADDCWASVGTANLDSVSLEEAHEFGIPFKSNVDLNVLVFDGADGEPRTGFARDLRVRLWSEFLRRDSADLAEAPKGGWLRLWREVADADFERLRNGECPDEILVLPYFPDGIPVDGIEWK